MTYGVRAHCINKIRSYVRSIRKWQTIILCIVILN